MGEIEIDKINELMIGAITIFDICELEYILFHMNDLDINTLSIQKGYSGYLCKVDEPTVSKFLEIVKGE